MPNVSVILERKFPQFNTVSPDHLVSDALYQMCAENVDYLIVMNGEKFVGILTEHDVTNKVLFANKPLNELKVQDFLNKNLPVASSNNSLAYCMQLLERHNARYLAIYDDFTFKGVVSANDLMHEMIANTDSEYGDISQDQEYSWVY
ncbi:CBS domain-containing protein [Chitinophagaceae bacterium LB-8]|uniref:CBS domain-containing protein n=1 Tax=Paraflavisolibacter caeni TaxID=2982496 RepID=A0A9X3BJP3_9BACT|nr:CBS domain-containing protein [Paraflavisolibacter caeni]MCU7551483.1 CBS domain-containing protein [Paraflavisolibacter caeni]